VSHRNNLNLAAAQPVDQAEGKPGKDVASSASTRAGPSLWRLGHRLNGMPQLFPKTMRRR